MLRSANTNHITPLISENHRLFWPDVVRAAAIFLVVYVHQLYLLPPLSFHSLLVWIPQLFTHIGVPLFVLVSGAMLLPKDESLARFFKKRVTRVLFPWIFWIGIYTCLSLTVFSMQFASFSAFLKYEYQLFFSRFWFLPMIFGLYLLTPILRVFVRNARIQILYYFLILWFICIVFLPVIPAFLNREVIQNTTLLFFVLQYIGLYVLGFVLVVSKQIISKVVWIGVLLLSMILTYIATYFDSFSIYPQIDRTFSRIFSPTFLPGIISVFMILYILFKNRKVSQTLFQRVIREISICTLGIYLVHELVQQLLDIFVPILYDILIQMSSVFAIPIRAGIVFSLSFLLIAFLRRLPFLKFVVT